MKNRFQMEADNEKKNEIQPLPSKMKQFIRVEILFRIGLFMLALC